MAKASKVARTNPETGTWLSDKKTEVRKSARSGAFVKPQATRARRPVLPHIEYMSSGQAVYTGPIPPDAPTSPPITDSLG